MVTTPRKGSSVAIVIVALAIGLIRPAAAIADDVAVSESPSDAPTSALDAINRARLNDDEPVPSPKLFENAEPTNPN